MGAIYFIYRLRSIYIYAGFGIPCAGPNHEPNSRTPTATAHDSCFRPPSPFFTPERLPQASPDGLSLYFGSAIGVVTGFVTLWDARPGCISLDTPKGHVLPMANRGDGVASQPVRFKVWFRSGKALWTGNRFGDPLQQVLG